ncbi:hypothetical protein LD001_27805, partial [Pseudomonas kurunegalensis]|uniref:hypothetical protein n=1 Tax=Pseudomonas kurunegalensis TaxID=485880 RepID=UPI001CDC7A18
GIKVHASIFSVLIRSSAARAAHRELCSLLRFFGPVNLVADAQYRVVGTTQYNAMRQGVCAQIPRE